MVDEKRTIPPVMLVLIAVLLWSTGGLFIKLTTLDAYQVTFFRSLFAGITVLILMRKKGLRINGFGIVVTCFYSTLLFLFVWATKQTTAANAIFLQYTAPVYILILAPFFIGEKFKWRDVVTVIFCIGGMSLFFVGDLSIGDYRGNIAALGSGICLGLYIMLLKHPRFTGVSNPQVSEVPLSESPAPGSDIHHSSFIIHHSDAPSPASGSDIHHPSFIIHHSVAPRPLNPIVTVIYGNFLLAILTLPSGITAINTAAEGLTAGTMPLSGPMTDIFAVAFLGIFQIGVSYILFINGVAGGTRPLDASIIGFIEPLLNPVWVFLFVGEQPQKWAILGGAIIITTVAAHTFAQYRRPPPTNK